MPSPADYPGLGAAPRREPRLPDAVGADLAGRRPDAHRLPPPHPPLPCRGPRGPRLSVLHLPADRLRAARRDHAFQRHARHDADGDARLLDGRAARQPRPHDERGQGARALRLQRASPASPGGRLPAAQCRLDAASSRRSASAARGWRAASSASTAAGRTTSSSRSSPTIRRPSARRSRSAAKRRIHRGFWPACERRRRGFTAL